MIPILSDFQASISDDNQFEISWLSKKRETRSFVASNAESMGVLLRTISKSASPGLSHCQIQIIPSECNAPVVLPLAVLQSYF